MHLSSLPASLLGWTVIPDIAALRTDLIDQLGDRAGNQAADQMPMDGWLVTHDMRLQGSPDSFRVENPRHRCIPATWSARHFYNIRPPLVREARVEPTYTLVLREMDVVTLMTVLSREIFAETGKGNTCTPRLRRLQSLDESVRAQREAQEMAQEGLAA